MKYLILFFFLGITLQAHSNECNSEKNSISKIARSIQNKMSQGSSEKYLEALKAQGFSCEDENKESASHCFGCLPPSKKSKNLCLPSEPYSRLVHIFIPMNFDSKKPMSLTYHFHGWNQSANDNPFNLKVGNFGKYLQDSGKNSILIVPESYGKNEDHKRLNSPEKIDNFMKSISDSLKSAGIPYDQNTPVNLTGHSGAYSHLSKWASFKKNEQIQYLKNLNGVALLDSLYSYKPAFVDWNPKKTLIIFNPTQDADKNIANKLLYKNLCPNPPCENVQITTDSKTQHVDFVNKYMTQVLSEF